MSTKTAVMNSKLRTSWIAALGVLFLIWTIWTLDLHTYLTSMPSSTVSTQTKLRVTPEGNTDLGMNTPLGDFDDDLTTTDESPDDLESSPISTDLSLNSTSEPEPIITDRPLILYAYFETALARTNLEFFITHGLHDGADFVFILNGNTSAADIIPDEPNIRYVRRPNDCYDLGAFAEVLVATDLYKKYNRFITMNASIRGPFLPYYANGCWSDMYLSRITEKVKLVGMTMNCQPYLPPHVQSMIWATDRIGLEILLFPSTSLIQTFKSSLPPHNNASRVPALESPGINSCPHEYWKAVAIEVYSTPLIRAAGYEVDVMMSAFHGDERGTQGYEEKCFDTGDVLFPGSYYGMSLHPFDTVFAKTNRGNNPLVLERLTKWTRGRGYRSYDHCAAL